MDMANKNSGQFTRRAALAAGGAGLTAFTAGCMGIDGDDEIVIGTLSSRTGGVANIGEPMHAQTQMAIEDINDNGGVLGEELVSEDPDPQSDNERYTELARRLILEDEVDALFGGITSASREAIRPVVDDNQQLYFYPAIYEGGVCDQFVYNMGAVPTQQIRPVVEFMVDEFGGRCYTIAADYNFGHVTAMWNEIYVEEELGGEVINEEFIPLEVSDFSSTIARIQDHDPDWVLTNIVGENHAAYFEQALSAGLEYPMATSTNIGSGYEHKFVPEPALEGMYTSWNYVEEIETDENEEYVNRLHDEYDVAYANQQGFSQHHAIKLWAEAVEEAGTTDMAEVNAVLENEEPTISTPVGPLSVDGPTHHMSHNMYTFEILEDHSFDFHGVTESVPPEWEREVCNLGEDSSWDDPITEFYTPLDEE